VNGIQPIVRNGAKFPTAQDKGRVFIYPELSRFLEFPTFVEQRNETPETRDQLDGVRDQFIAANPDCKHDAGGRDADSGEQKAEKALPNPTPPRGKDGRTGSVFPDLTFKCSDGRFIYVNTYDPYATGEPTRREARNADRIEQRMGDNDVLILIAKPRP
jgi:hypothetical protein